MNKYISLAIAASFATLPLFAEGDKNEEESATEQKTEEFMSDEKLEEGFLTHYLNNAIAQGMESSSATETDKSEYGRTVTKWASAPKFGGYVIGSYKYSDEEGKENGPGFGVRLVRAYVDGTIFNDFKYRLQLQFSGTPHIKDFFIDWVHWKEFGVKIGQYKRSFTFENPYNPWDVGTGDYSQLVQKFAGMGDICGEPNMGGRDQGIQLHGDLFPIGQDKHRLVHYELGLYNGQGINATDKNKRKDFIGSIQFQPIKNLYIGGFYWNGDYVNGSETLDRNRYCFGAKYETTQWSARMEYARECSDKYNGADALYLTAGIPCTPWLKTYLKYDLYRFDGTNDTAKTIYTVAPNFQLHKNLMFQVQYNFVHENYISKDLTTLSKNHSEFWVETYFRF